MKLNFKLNDIKQLVVNCSQLNSQVACLKKGLFLTDSILIH